MLSLPPTGLSCISKHPLLLTVVVEPGQHGTVVQTQLRDNQLRMRVNRVETHMLRALDRGLDRLVFELSFVPEIPNCGTLWYLVPGSHLKNGHPAALQAGCVNLRRFAGNGR